MKLNDEEVWYGGYYEAAIVVGLCSEPDADQKIRQVLQIVWEHPNTSNCFMSRKIEENKQHPVKLWDTNFDVNSSLYGWLLSDQMEKLPFYTSTVQETDTPDGLNWVFLSLPTGGLSKVIKNVGGYPFESKDNSRTWRPQIDEHLSNIVLKVAESVPFLCALIEFERCGLISKNELQGKIPSQRKGAYVVKHQGKYKYFPTNKWV